MDNDIRQWHVSQYGNNDASPDRSIVVVQGNAQTIQTRQRLRNSGKGAPHQTSLQVRITRTLGMIHFRFRRLQMVHY